MDDDSSSNVNKKVGSNGRPKRESIYRDKSDKSKGNKDAERIIAEKAELELLLSDDDDDYDMRAIHKAEKDALKGAKGKRKSRNRKPKDGEDISTVAGGDFELDLTDNRFASLLEGDIFFFLFRDSMTSLMTVTC